MEDFKNDPLFNQYAKCRHDSLSYLLKIDSGSTPDRREIATYVGVQTKCLKTISSLEQYANQYRNAKYINKALISSSERITIEREVLNQISAGNRESARKVGFKLVTIRSYEESDFGMLMMSNTKRIDPAAETHGIDFGIVGALIFIAIIAIGILKRRGLTTKEEEQKIKKGVVFLALSSAFSVITKAADDASKKLSDLEEKAQEQAKDEEKKDV